jgi:hypothetical protein
MNNDENLGGLPAEGRAAVAKWLFDDGLSLREAAVRCERDYKVKLGKSSLGRFYQRESMERLKRQVSENPAASGNGLAEGEINYRAVLLTMSRMALEKAQNPACRANRRVAVEFTKVLVSARREQHEALRVTTMREKFEFDAAAACLLHQAEVEKIAEDSTLDEEERIQKIRRTLFGTNLPD